MTTNSENQPLMIGALVVAIIALVLSAISGTKTIQYSKELMELRTLNDETAFNAKVEKGIQAYIQKQEEANKPAPPGSTTVTVSVDDDPVKGSADAPVTIVEFSEYQCPFCSRYASQTLTQIQEKYISTGKVKYVFRDFPLGFHQNARPAAIAAECAREQGGDETYYKYHDVLFKNQKALEGDNLKKYAADLGLDKTKFNTCLDEEKYGDEVDADLADGQKAGIQGTPGFFINGRMVSGAQPFSVFEKIIEEELNK